MLARIRAEAAERPGPAARLPRHGARASARPTGCSRRAIAASSAARTSSSASSRPTAGRTRSSCSTASRSCPRRRIEYRGVVVEEMDTDAIIAREPDGRPGRRARPHQRARARARAKRWEDVEVIRDAGIHVVTTLQRPAPRERRRRGRDDHRRAGQRAPARRRPARRRRDRARRHEPARAPPADEARQRLPARARPGRARQVLHRGEPDRAPRAGAAARRPARRGPAGGHRSPAKPLPLVTDRVARARRRQPGVRPGDPAGGEARERDPRGRSIAVVVETPASERPVVRPSPRPPGGASTTPSTSAPTSSGSRRRTWRTASPRSPSDGGRPTSSCPYREVGGLRRLRERSLVERVLERLPEVEVHAVSARRPRLRRRG